MTWWNEGNGNTKGLVRLIREIEFVGELLAPKKAQRG